MNRVGRVHQTTHDEVAEGRKKTSTAKTQKAYNLVLGVCRCCCCFGMILTRLHTQTHLELDIPTDTTKMHIQHSLPKLT